MVVDAPTLKHKIRHGEEEPSAEHPYKVSFPLAAIGTDYSHPGKSRVDSRIVAHHQPQDTRYAHKWPNDVARYGDNNTANEKADLEERANWRPGVDGRALVH